MKDDLAEVLLAKVMQWGTSNVNSQRPYLQAMAAYKYDGYQQFSPGMRFIESLAIWLHQFKTVQEKQIAYDFIKKRLIFISQNEIAHLVATAYPDLIRHIILKKAATLANIPEYMITKISKTIEFKVLQRQSLFLALSDGAYIDIFRRSNASEIKHDQVYRSYEIGDDRAPSMLFELENDLREYLGKKPTQEGVRFKMVFLLDDFSGSGLSYLRPDNGKFVGKIAKFYKEASTRIDIKEAEVYLILYISTEQALEHLQKFLPKLWGGSGLLPKICVVHQLQKSACLSSKQDADFYKLCRDKRYYDAASLEDKHTKVGGVGVQYGFCNCCLPLVLYHNTPNNSIALLWAYDNASFRGLFPRIPRHKEAI